MCFSSEKAMAPHSSTLAWKIHGQRSLVGYSPWGHYESGMTERLHFHFSLSCIGEGNGNLLQCSCLENSRDGCQKPPEGNQAYLISRANQLPDVQTLLPYSKNGIKQNSSGFHKLCSGQIIISSVQKWKFTP